MQLNLGIHPVQPWVTYKCHFISYSFIVTTVSISCTQLHVLQVFLTLTVLQCATVAVVQVLLTLTLLQCAAVAVVQVLLTLAVL